MWAWPAGLAHLVPTMNVSCPVFLSHLSHCAVSESLGRNRHHKHKQEMDGTSAQTQRFTWPLTFFFTTIPPSPPPPHPCPLLPPPSIVSSQRSPTCYHWCLSSEKTSDAKFQFPLLKALRENQACCCIRFTPCSGNIWNPPQPYRLSCLCHVHWGHL